MPNNITDPAELRMLDWINVVGTPVRPTGPLKVALVTANGSDSAAGTEVTASGGTAYVRQNLTLSAAAAGSAANTNLVEFLNMPAATVVGLEIWDSAGTPVRLWYGPLAANKTTNAGDTLQVAIGALTTSLD